MSQLQRVTKEQAVKLKKLGFNRETDAYYYLDNPSTVTANYDNWNKYGNTLSACPLELACKFLRDTKKALIYVFPIDDWEHYGVKVLFPDLSAPFHEIETEPKDYPTYESAQSAGLDVALEYLINN